ncbi:hypothetical protein [Maridesulfovibrio hydrothermalis]|uniref:Uncharacterized protein n=1 Tax=Maridesulfovibrio hydrothermalis AM13 = DSM 14728 TaxID=1121451 RepID=L0R699_9BACT|nr:hypothetical protein [Maridesulfovibrio hydrothermalis]CCO22219.1 conserved protein of unknown function [Maridesulfovibrio hydrothermalis AM13 = DSM 14728]
MPYNALARMIAAFTNEFPECKTVKIYSGKFTAENVHEVANNLPAILIACLGISITPPYNGDRTGILRMSAFILTTSGPDQMDKDAMAMNMVSRTLLMLDDDWVLENPKRMDASNLSSSCDGTNTSLWSVSWEQPVVLQDTPLVKVYEGEKLKSVFLGQAPKIGTAHKEDYTEIGKDDK